MSKFFYLARRISWQKSPRHLSRAIPVRCALLLLVSLWALLTTAQAADNTATAADEPQQSQALYQSFGGANTPEDSDDMWLPLREKYFQDRPIESSRAHIRLNAPSRAEDDARVPVSIDLVDAQQRASDDPFRKVYLIVDVNPAPVGGIFSLTQAHAMQQLNTRVRVNGYTYIRAVAETASGKLYMDKQWVKSTGAGCSAPPGLDQAKHLARLGNMRFKLLDNNAFTQASALQLIISHPNNTGLQRDQLSTMMIPEHYVTDVDVRFNDAPVLSAKTTFTLSENPKFSFSFKPDESGVLSAQVKDNKNNTFHTETTIQGLE